MFAVQGLSLWASYMGLWVQTGNHSALDSKMIS
jgi:hypothetical protein